MKKGCLLNSELSYLVATLGHTDEVTIADAGLPIPDVVERVDLALTHGIPSFADTVSTLLESVQIEGVVVAEEFEKVSPQLYQSLISLLDAERKRSNKEITVTTVPHEEFKARTYDSRAVVRTGECTPYANVIFQSGVAF